MSLVYHQLPVPKSILDFLSDENGSQFLQNIGKIFLLYYILRIEYNKIYSETYYTNIILNKVKKENLK